MLGHGAAAHNPVAGVNNALNVLAADVPLVLGQLQQLVDGQQQQQQHQQQQHNEVIDRLNGIDQRQIAVDQRLIEFNNIQQLMLTAVLETQHRIPLLDYNMGCKIINASRDMDGLLYPPHVLVVPVAAQGQYAQLAPDHLPPVSKTIIAEMDLDALAPWMQFYRVPGWENMNVGLRRRMLALQMGNRM